MPPGCWKALTPRSRWTLRAARCAQRDVDEVDDEDERLARLDRAAGAAVAVGQVRGDGEPAAAADLHADDALVPAADDLADAEAEVQRRAAVPRRVELLAGGVGHADVVRRDGVAGAGLAAVALGEVLDDQLGRGGVAREVDLGLGGARVKTPWVLLRRWSSGWWADCVVAQ